MGEYWADITAIVDDGAVIGCKTKVWHFSHVMTGAVIGENCVLGQNVFVGSKAIIGNRVKIQNNVSIYDRVILEDDVFCGPSCVFTNVMNPRSFIERKSEYRETRVERGATIGANATIVCGVKIGRYALIGAGSVVTRNVPDFALVYGAPAKIHGWVSKSGVKLGEDLICPETGERYQIMQDGLIEMQDSRSAKELEGE